MKNGLYIAAFRTPLDDAKGVIMIQDGTVAGGDSGMYYKGSVTGSEGDLKVNMTVVNHDPSRLSVFGDFERFDLTLQGKKKGDEFVFEGWADAAPSLRFKATLTYTGD